MVDISKAPYHDRFNPDKGYERVLFNPDRPLQASELIEMQSMSAHNIGELGNALMRDGNIQEGMDFVVEGDKITVHDGKVFLNGKIRKFTKQTVPFENTGRYNIGVRLKREVITARDDDSLLDPAVGTRSYMSEGADRLKETVELVAGDEANSATIYTFVNGNLFTQQGNPELERINEILAERTYDESGSYRVSGFDLYTEPHPTDSTKLNLVVDSGRAYVLGYQVDKPTSTRVPISKSLGTRTVNSEAFYYNTATRRGRLGNAPVASVQRVTGQVKVTKELVNRGATADSLDHLAHSSVFAIERVWTESNGETTATFRQGTDFQLVNGNAIDWSPNGNEPSAGSTYFVTYSYNKTMVRDTDYKITVEGSGDNRVWYIDFNDTYGNKPIADSMVTVDYTYYLARKDIVVLDKDGEITVVSGQPDSLRMVSAPSHLDPYTLLLGTITVFPDSETTLPTKSNLNRLSMADLQRMKTRIDNLEYNDAVNALDQPSMAGVNPVNLRGVFSDGFISLDKFDVSHPDATVAFSFEDAEITLPFANSTKRKPNLNQSSSLAHVWGRLVTAPFTEKRAISQPSATEAFNINPYNVYNNRGVLSITPSEDNWIEEDRVVVTQEETETRRVRRWWAHRGEGWEHQEMMKVADIQLDEGQKWEGKSWSYDVKNGRTGTTLRSGGSQTLEEMIEYMRQIDIQFHVKNLTPNSNNLVLTFDGIRVPITPASGFRRGSESGTIMSNENGEAKGTFTIPPGVRTGVREVMLRNADNTATTTFVAQGTKKTVQDVIIRTRVTIDLYDPLAQSFQFSSNQVVSSFGLYFASKDPNKNVAVQVRGISEGGMPNKTIYAETVLTPSQIKVSNDGTAETKVTFDDPLVADAGREYAIVLMTNSDKYTVWVATRGQEDINGGGTVTSNPYVTGVLYSSSNASAWTPHQDSDLKFNVYTADFNDRAVLEFDTMSNVQADSILLMATYLTPENTGCIWDMKLVLENEPPNVTVADKDWLPIANYVDVELGQVAREVKLRATFKANSNMSPLLSLNDILFTSFLTALSGSYVSRTIDSSDSPFNVVRMSYDAFTPANTSVTPRYSVDGGTTWREFTVAPTTSQQSNEFTRYVYEEKVTNETEGYTSIKFRLDLQSQNSFSRPRASSLMTNWRYE